MTSFSVAGGLTRRYRQRRAEMITGRAQALRAATTIARTVFEARQAMWREAERAASKLRHEPDN